jgi:hypothetical protein
MFFFWFKNLFSRKTDQLLTVNVEKKKSMAKTVFFVTALCTLCFAFRVIVSIYSIAQGVLNLFCLFVLNC